MILLAVIFGLHEAAVDIALGLRPAAIFAVSLALLNAKDKLQRARQAVGEQCTAHSFIVPSHLTTFLPADDLLSEA